MITDQKFLGPENSDIQVAADNQLISCCRVTLWPPSSKDAFLVKRFYYILWHFILEIYYDIDKGSSW